MNQSVFGLEFILLRFFCSTNPKTPSPTPPCVCLPSRYCFLSWLTVFIILIIKSCFIVQQMRRGKKKKKQGYSLLDDAQAWANKSTPGYTEVCGSRGRLQRRAGRGRVQPRRGASPRHSAEYIARVRVVEDEPCALFQPRIVDRVSLFVFVLITGKLGSKKGEKELI